MADDPRDAALQAAIRERDEARADAASLGQQIRDLAGFENECRAEVAQAHACIGEFQKLVVNILWWVRNGCSETAADAMRAAMADGWSTMGWRGICAKAAGTKAAPPIAEGAQPSDTYLTRQMRIADDELKTRPELHDRAIQFAAGRKQPSAEDMDRARAIFRRLFGAAPAISDGTCDAIASVVDERRRQMAEEGFGARHDDEHRTGELASAAACYALSAALDAQPDSENLDVEDILDLWPWDFEWWKPKETSDASGS